MTEQQDLRRLGPVSSRLGERAGRGVGDLHWTYLSPPPGGIAPGERTGTYQLALDMVGVREGGLDVGLQWRTLQLLCSMRRSGAEYPLCRRDAPIRTVVYHASTERAAARGMPAVGGLISCAHAA